MTLQRNRLDTTPHNPTIGASVGGVRTVAELRAAGFAGEIVLVDPDAGGFAAETASTL